jgi:hypothetical protein
VCRARLVDFHFGHDLEVATRESNKRGRTRLHWWFPLCFVPVSVIEAVRAGIAGRPVSMVFELGFVVLLFWTSRRRAERARAAQDQPHGPPRPYDERLLDADPPALVRLGYRMSFPVPRPWRPWAEARIERTCAQRVAAGAGPSGLLLFTPEKRRWSSLVAQGINPDDRSAPPLNLPAHSSQWSDEVLYWYPLGFILGSLFIVAATTVITLYFTL